MQMADEIEGRHTLSESAAHQFANATKTRAQWAGIYRLNRVKDPGDGSADVVCSPRRDRDKDLPETFVDCDTTPREYFLNAVTTVLGVQTRVSDICSHPYDQIQEQLRLLIEKVKERQEGELINNKEYGLLPNAAASLRSRSTTQERMSMRPSPRCIASPASEA
jgi:Phage capsid-like protein